MSTILDALKKSEQERKLNDLPTLSDMPPPVERPSMVKLAMLVGLVAILLASAILAIVYFVAEPAEQTRSITNETINNQIQAEAKALTNNQGVDSIVVNVISYSDLPDKRFAIINGNMVRENEFIQPGIKVQQIQPDSVTLNQRGQHFTLQP